MAHETSLNCGMERCLHCMFTIMPRAQRTALALAAIASVALAVPARAQTMTATILSIGNRASLSPARPLTVSMNLAECTAPATVVIRVDHIPATATNLDFWAGAGCQDATMRSTSTNTTCNCLNIDQATSGATQVDVTTTVQALLGVGATFRGSGTARECSTLGLDGDSQWPIIVLGVTTPCSVETGTVYATVSNGTATPFTVDTVPPLAPTGVTAGSGDTAVPVSWTASTGLGMGGSYAVFVDTSGGSGDAGGCDSATLVTGGTAPSSAYKSGIVALMTTVDASALGVALNGSAAVAVAAEDRAYNISSLSNVVCLTRTQSYGFWSNYTGSGGATPRCSVVMPGSTPGAAGLAGIALGLVGLGVALRLRTRRPR